METKKTSKTCKVGGRTSDKPCQKRYVTMRRSETNRLKRMRRHERRLAYFAKRRVDGKRNAYREARKGRGHDGRTAAAA